MTNTITQLANQALDNAVPETWSTLNKHQLEKFQAVFADMIIQRCVDICEQGTVTQTTSSGAANMIKQHFGIAS